MNVDSDQKTKYIRRKIIYLKFSFKESEQSPRDESPNAASIYTENGNEFAH